MIFLMIKTAMITIISTPPPIMSIILRVSDELSSFSAAETELSVPAETLSSAVGAEEDTAAVVVVVVTSLYQLPIRNCSRPRMKYLRQAKMILPRGLNCRQQIPYRQELLLLLRS